MYVCVCIHTYVSSCLCYVHTNVCNVLYMLALSASICREDSFHSLQCTYTCVLLSDLVLFVRFMRTLARDNHKRSSAIFCDCCKSSENESSYPLWPLSWLCTLFCPPAIAALCRKPSWRCLLMWTAKALIVMLSWRWLPRPLRPSLMMKSTLSLTLLEQKPSNQPSLAQTLPLMRAPLYSQGTSNYFTAPLTAFMYGCICRYTMLITYWPSTYVFLRFVFWTMHILIHTQGHLFQNFCTWQSYETLLTGNCVRHTLSMYSSHVAEITELYVYCVCSRHCMLKRGHVRSSL